MEKKKRLRTGWALQSDAFAMPCSTAHSSAQDRLDLQSDTFAMPCRVMPLPYLAVRLTPLLRTGWTCRVIPLPCLAE